MRLLRHLGLMSLLAAVMAVAPEAAQADPCAGNASAFTIEQAFPTSGTERTRWQVSGCPVGPFGLVIGVTSFRKAPASPFIQLFYDARVSEIFVIYHNGTHFFDIEEYSTGLMPLNTTRECPPSRGVLLARGRVCREVRDRGLSFKTETASRRGEQLVLWGVIRAANYKYLIEWTFRDDAVVEARVGATGTNNSRRHDVPHMHTVTWRLDIDLNGPAGDSVRQSRHLESSTGVTARDADIAITTEGSREWSPTQFSTWNIYDETLVNEQGKRSSFRLTPLRTGTSRHDVPYTQKDFWVTRVNRKSEETAAPDLPLYVSDQQSVSRQDIAVWYTGALHHEERDEDDNGATQLLPVGFMLKPHDFFSSSPLFP
jgi:Cu2+-containing amine oxidase